MRYRKKQLVVDVEGPLTTPQYIETLEGTMRADAGDYIITGIHGERYPCKAAVFHATYEPADDEERAAASVPNGEQPEYRSAR